jgi:hypothetical protein
MQDYCVRIKSHPIWAVIGNFYRQQSQARSQWLIKSAAQIGEMDALEINQVIWQVIWRTIINGIIILAVISGAIYTGYLHYQFPDPQHLDLLLLIGAVSCNILLTQILNFNYLRTILLFALLLGSLMAVARIVPFCDRMLMYIYTSWLLIFMLPIIYSLTAMAFDLRRFRNILISVTAIVAIVAYSLYPLAQFWHLDSEIDLLAISNQISFLTFAVCSIVFIIFGTIAKFLQFLPQLGMLSISEISRVRNRH